jgi:hypothetical protein
VPPITLPSQAKAATAQNFLFRPTYTRFGARRHGNKDRSNIPCGNQSKVQSLNLPANAFCLSRGRDEKGCSDQRWMDACFGSVCLLAATLMRHRMAPARQSEERSR